jgi:hypothetical protein
MERDEMLEILEEEVTVEPGDEPGAWIVELYDDVRAAAGDDAIERLEQSLVGNVGVTEAVFEDREVLVVEGPRDPDELKRWIVAELYRTGTPIDLDD